MSHDLHERARELILGGAASAADERWLQQHLAECPHSASLLARTQAVRSALHSLPLTADPEMVQAAQQRVLRHALELAERESRRWMLTASVAVAALFAWISVPLLWEAAQWVGGMTAAPEAAAIAVFAAVWLVPALLAAGAAFALRNGSPKVHEGFGRR